MEFLSKIKRMFLGDSGPSKAKPLDPEAKKQRARLINALAKGNIEKIEENWGDTQFDTRLRSGNCAIHIAAKHGRTNSMEWLIGRGDKVNRPSDHKRTPLDEAVCEKQLDAVKWLIQHGAKLTIADLYDCSTIQMAACGGANEILEFLAPIAGRSRLRRDKADPLVDAINFGDHTTVRLLLEHGCSPNFKGNSPSYPMTYASEKGDRKLVDLLIAHGADARWLTKDRCAGLIWGNIERKHTPDFVAYLRGLFPKVDYDDLRKKAEAFERDLHEAGRLSREALEEQQRNAPKIELKPMPGLMDRANEFLESLTAIPWFENVGQPMDDSVTAVKNWAEMEKWINGRKWGNFRLAIMNRFQGLPYEGQYDRTDLDETIEYLRSFISSLLAQPLTELDRHQPNQNPKDRERFSAQAAYDVHLSGIEYVCQDFFRPLFFLPVAFPWYERGHLPCGWHGTMIKQQWNGNSPDDLPAGKLRVY